MCKAACRAPLSNSVYVESRQAWKQDSSSLDNFSERRNIGSDKCGVCVGRWTVSVKM